MSTERAYKALDFDLKLYGFWPLDICGLLVAFALVHGTWDSLLLDLIVLGPMAFLAWRGRKRAPGYMRSLFLFVTTPARFPVARRQERYP